MILRKVGENGGHHMKWNKPETQRQLGDIFSHKGSSEKREYMSIIAALKMYGNKSWK